MPRRLLKNPALTIYSVDGAAETPILDESTIQNNNSGISLGEAIMNYQSKRFWIGMGLGRKPFELTSVFILENSGETPDVGTLYPAGTLIINTVDNLAWVGTGNQTTEGSFISVSGGDLDGGTF
jgi:hypothetical protein